MTYSTYIFFNIYLFLFIFLIYDNAIESIMRKKIKNTLPSSCTWAVGVHAAALAIASALRPEHCLADALGTQGNLEVRIVLYDGSVLLQLDHLQPWDPTPSAPRRRATPTRGRACRPPTPPRASLHGHGLCLRVAGLLGAQVRPPGPRPWLGSRP